MKKIKIKCFKKAKEMQKQLEKIEQKTLKYGTKYPYLP